MDMGFGSHRIDSGEARAGFQKKKRSGERVMLIMHYARSADVRNLREAMQQIQRPIGRRTHLTIHSAARAGRAVASANYT